MNYRQDIDGFRALAVLIVVIFHAFPEILPNGFLGVDIFFVISGFLITSIITSNLQNDKFSFVNFYIRRIKRIFPMAFLVLWVVSLIGMLTLFDTEFKYLKILIRSASGYYINFQLLNDSGYFDLRSNYKPLLHYWSLAIEEQFYLVWPFLLYIKYKIIKLLYRNTAGSKSNILNILIYLTAILLFFSFYYFYQQSGAMYFSSFTRAWELLVGCFASLILSRMKLANLKEEVFNKKYGQYFVFVSYLLLLSALFVADKKNGTIQSVIAAAIYLLSADSVKLKYFFKNKVVVYFGLISFSLYLWHWPVLSFYRIYKPNLTHTETIALLLLSFLLSHISYVYIEAPLKEQNWDLIAKKWPKPVARKIYFKISGCLFIALALFMVSPHLPKLKDKIQNQLEFVEDDSLNLKADCLLSEAERVQNNLTWCYRESDLNKKNTHEGLVFGDSHAHSTYRGLVNSDPSTSWELVANHSCPPFAIDKNNSHCGKIVRATLEYLSLKNNIDYVLLVMANRIFDEYHTLLESDVDSIAMDYTKIIKAGKKVYIQLPVPEIADNIYACVATRFSFYKVFDSTDICQIALQQWELKSKNYKLFLNRLIDKVPEIVLIESTDVICKENICSAAREGKAVYEDKDHLSFYGSQLLAKKISEVVN